MNDDRKRWIKLSDLTVENMNLKGKLRVAQKRVDELELERNDLSTEVIQIEKVTDANADRLSEIRKKVDAHEHGLDDLVVSDIRNILDKGCVPYRFTGEGDNLAEVGTMSNLMWNLAPTWANYHAVHSDGEAFWYGEKPANDLDEGYWCSAVFDNTEFDQHLPPPADWKETLRKRP